MRGRPVVVAIVVGIVLAIALSSGCHSSTTPRLPEPTTWWGRLLLGGARAVVCEQPVDAGTNASPPADAGTTP